MKRIGVTGGIGAGKSLFVQKLKDLGAFVILADDLAKQLMVQDHEVVSAINKTFGKASYLPDGTLNREFLAKEAFERGRVAELNAIVHPAVFKATEALFLQAEQKGYPVAVKEAALLLDKGRPKDLDIIVVLTAPEKQRIQRVMQREQATQEHIKSRIEKQKKDDYLTSLADIIVVNDGTKADLEAKAEELYTTWTA